MQVLIVGGGRTGADLASQLIQEGHNVTLIEQRQELISRLAKEVPRAQVIHGDGCEPTVLEQANVRRANVVVAVTDDDEDNLVVCLLAREEFRVRRTLARVNNPRNEWLFNEDWGIDVAVSTPRMLASLVEARECGAACVVGEQCT